MSVLCKTEEIIVDTNEYNSDEADENIRLTLEDSGGESYHQSYQPDQHHSSPRQRNVISVTRNLITQSGKSSSKSIMENEKRMRREIANSNERRRMQSINAGFQSLRSLLPHHEGEKLSKAAILQQTAQYILDLEREKTNLLSQNSQLKRLLGQHEMGAGCGSGGGGGGNENSGGAGAIKKRKLTDNIMTVVQTISDSSDEGLGSMSPEPVTLLTNGTKTGTYISSNTKEITELKGRLEAERKLRTVVEERLRQLERQIYPNQYIQREVIEHTDNLRDDEVSVSIINDPLKLQVVEIDSLPAVGETQVVVCSSLEEIQEEEVCTITEDMVHGNVREEIVVQEDTAEYVEVPSRLQPILEAAIKAEPKVEVERINATLTKIKSEPNATKDGKPGNSRMYLTSTSRQNLETIVEAIRHLEGDHLFGDLAEQKKAQQQQKPTAQEVPLALTNKQQQQRKLPVELSPFLQLKKQNNSGNTVTIVGTTSKVAGATLTNASSSSTNSSNNCNSSSNVKCTSSNSTSSSSTISGGSIHSTVKTVTLASSSTITQPKSSTVVATVTPTSTTQVTIASASLKQCRPGVIVAKQIS